LLHANGSLSAGGCCRYDDAFREEAGRDKEWSLGTRLNPSRVHSWEPTSLRTQLLDVAQREMVLAAGLDGSAPANVPGARRTTCILLQHPVPPQLPFHTLQANVVTSLAGNTCHLAVHLVFSQTEVDEAAALGSNSGGTWPCRTVAPADS
jgi:hypothetical protein